MKFSYETQGAITYLVCELDATEQIDSLTLGMLINNHIQGLAPVLYTEMNGQRFLKYNISAKITADQFFSGTLNKKRTLTAFSNILEAICSADEYMIDSNCFSVGPEHIFLNVSNCETGLICIPVMVEKDINKEVAELFKKILFSTQFDENEDAGYITQLITYLNSAASFNVYGLKDLVQRLESGSAEPAQPAYKAPVQPAAQPVAPSFDSTISIDAMFTTMGGSQQPVQKEPVPQPRPVAPVDRPPVQPVAPQPAVPVDRPPVQPVAPQPVVPQPRPVSVQPVQQPQPAIPKPAASNTPGFAIPGQPAPAMPPVTEQKSKKQKKEKTPAKPVEQGEKKKGFGGLFSRRSKEESANKKAKNENVPQPVMPQEPVQGVAGATPVQSPFAYTPPQYQPPVQPVPVQNSFNETTVLISPAMAGGETTVLSVAPSIPNPCLTRVKSGEKISINKPVYRIGKEKSYVDYFIGDNTAISRSHCNIHSENGEYFIEDTNSTNHTFVNGELITSNVKTKLKSGDKVRLANEDFIFSV